MKKIFYLFAGVNGAGKSTLYNLAMINQNIKNTIRINTDEIVREIGDWRNNSDQLKAAKMAINLRNECFLCGKSFNEETTLTGKTILKTIDKAKELGYELQLFYVGLNSPEIAKAVFETPLNKVGIINPNKATIVVFQKTKEVKAEEANFTKLKEEVRKDYINKQVGEYMSKLF